MDRGSVVDFPLASAALRGIRFGLHNDSPVAPKLLLSTGRKPAARLKKSSSDARPVVLVSRVEAYADFSTALHFSTAS